MARPRGEILAVSEEGERRAAAAASRPRALRLASRPDALLPAAPQITRASTTVPGATMTSSRKAPRPRRLRRRWTCPSFPHPALLERPWVAWSTHCQATTLRVRRRGSPTSWHIPRGTHPAQNPACPGLCTPCQLRSLGPARPSPRCLSMAGRATETTCPIPQK